MQSPLLLAAFLLTALSMGGVAVNELSHGGLAEIMGFGHRHMFDHGGYHCAAHDHSEHGARHMEHMHATDHHPHDQCSGGGTMHSGTGHRNQEGPMHG